MATRLSLEDKLAEIRAMRIGPPATHAIELRRYLGDKSNLVVAAAAALVGERTFSELAGDLENAFDRFLSIQSRRTSSAAPRSPSLRRWRPSSISSGSCSRKPRAMYSPNRRWENRWIPPYRCVGPPFLLCADRRFGLPHPARRLTDRLREGRTDSGGSGARLRRNGRGGAGAASQGPTWGCRGGRPL